MSSDDSTAEKAWGEYFEVEQHKTLYLPGSLREAFMAGRASKPDVTALLRERAELREQLAEAEKERNSFKRLWQRTDSETEQEASGLVEQLAEAQATIEAVRALCDEVEAVDGRDISSADFRAALSAPSSTGGATNGE